MKIGDRVRIRTGRVVWEIIYFTNVVSGGRMAVLKSTNSEQTRLSRPEDLSLT